MGSKLGYGDVNVLLSRGSEFFSSRRLGVACKRHSSSPLFSLLFLLLFFAVASGLLIKASYAVGRAPPGSELESGTDS